MIVAQVGVFSNPCSFYSLLRIKTPQCLYMLGVEGEAVENRETFYLIEPCV